MAISSYRIAVLLGVAWTVAAAPAPAPAPQAVASTTPAPVAGDANACAQVAFSTDAQRAANPAGKLQRAGSTTSARESEIANGP